MSIACDTARARIVPRPTRRRARGTARRGLRDGRRAATSLEFAVAGVVFIVVVLGIIEFGYDLFVQAVLDQAVAQAARGVQVGATQGTAGETGAALVKAAVCPATGGLLNCNLLIVGVAPVASGGDFYANTNQPNLTTAASTGGSVCTGAASQAMVLTAWYMGPSFLGALIPSFTTSYNGGTAHITTSTAGWVNEAFFGGQTSGVGC